MGDTDMLLAGDGDLGQIQAVFLDRDGVLIADTGYIGDPARVRILDGVPEAIRLLNTCEIKTLVVTNQSGVARGYFSEKDIVRVHKTIQSQLADAGAMIDAFYYCPHHPDATVVEYRKDCCCRKPNTGMFLQAAREWQIDLASTYVIGDKMTDVLAGQRVGAHTILISSAHDPCDVSTFGRCPDLVVQGLLPAIRWILQK